MVGLPIEAAEDELRLADYVIERVARLGVKHIFTLAGGGAMHLDDALAGNAEVEFVCNLHEQACAIAAEAYARVTNNLGVALVTTGPGGRTLSRASPGLGWNRLPA